MLSERHRSTETNERHHATCKARSGGSYKGLASEENAVPAGGGEEKNGRKIGGVEKNENLVLNEFIRVKLKR